MGVEAVQQKQHVAKYKPGGPTVKRFHESKAFVRGIRGPIGSSKSTACVMEILSRAMEQKPGPDGRRRTRWAIIRNSYPELKTTTLKTWNQWVPAAFGKLTMDSPIRHYINTAEIEMEVLFLALDRAEDVAKLLSLELTGAWINEAREIPKPIVDGLTGRVGRFPPVNEGGCTWSGILMDTNPPDDQSWWYKFAEEEVPEDWEFFSQPSGRSKDAENLENLIPNYYKRICSGKDPEWIQVYVDGEYGYLIEGKPVYEKCFRDRTHVPVDDIEPVEELPLMIGADFGLTPAAVIGQKLPNGRWIIIDELVTENTGVKRFATELKSYVATKYPDFTIDGCFCDPAGGKRSELDENTAQKLMNAGTGWTWRLAPSNALGDRIEAVTGAFNRLVDGDPGLMISKRAKVLRKGCSSGYHFKLLASGDGTQTQDVPNKNKYSHPHDALQYLLLGGGEHNVMMGASGRKKREERRQAAQTEYNPLKGVSQQDAKKEPPWKKRLRERNANK